MKSMILAIDVYFYVEEPLQMEDRAAIIKER
jgi:hypothetical protein